MKYKKGQSVIISKRTNGHGFKIGETVVIKEVFSNHYDALGGGQEWSVTDEEIKKSEMKYKKGQALIIKKDISDHEFRIGELVIVTKVHDEDYEVSNGIEEWFVTDEEVKKLTKKRLCKLK